MDEKLPPTNEAEENDDQLMYEKISKISEDACLSRIHSSLDNSLEGSDVAESRIKAETSLQDLLTICEKHFIEIRNNSAGTNRKLRQQAVCSCLVLCLEHVNKDNIWTSNESLKLSSNIIDIFCKFYSCESVGELISNEQHQLLPEVFKLLRPKLLKDNWKSYPAAVSSYLWILDNLMKPAIGRNLHMLMPTALIILDDYLASNRILGLKCLDRIVRNISKSEFDSYCSDDSIYRLLYPMIYNFEPSTVEPVISCICAVLGKRLDDTEKMKWTHYDDIMGAWLSAMSMEQKLDLRASYIKCFPMFITSMGFACVRWSERIINVFEEYSVYHKEQEHCFKAMLVFIRETWKRTDRHFPKLIVILLKALHDLSEEDSTARNENYENRVSSIAQCLSLLKKLAPEQMDKIVSDLRTDSTFSEIVKKYF